MKKITIDRVLKLNPCEEYNTREKLLNTTGGRTSLTMLEISNLRIPAQDRIWVLLYVMNKKTVIEIANKIANKVVKKYCSKCGIEEVEQWAKEWLSGSDRSYVTAADAAAASAANVYAAAASAAASAAAAANAYASAAYAATAAANAAYAAYAYANAAYAANAAANAANANANATAAAYDAADAAYAASAANASNAAAERKWQLNLIKKYLQGK